MMRDIKTTELSSYLIKVGEWAKAPARTLEIIKDIEEEYGGNIAIGHHSELGWFILHDQGYGVGLVWKESDYVMELPGVQDSVQSETS